MAQYANLLTGLKVGSASAVDKRLILTKAEMKNCRFSDGQSFKIPTHTDDTAPINALYMALCYEDKKLYLYNAKVPASDETGNFHPIEEFLDFTQSEAAQEQFEKAVEDSPVIIDLTETVLDEDDGLVKKVADIQEEIQNIKIDGKVIGG